jgi:dihydrodipicolinate synthase/N-acetylneuraminate lyase
MSLPFKRNEAKEWARENFKGTCNVTLPSFTPDFKRLNDKGIRHDIRKAAADGFWGTLLVSECSTTVEEYKQFIDIAVDERPKGFYLVAHGSFDTIAETIDVMKYAADRGVEANLLAYVPSFWPKNADDVYQYTKEVADKTDLALILFGVHHWGYKRLDPRSFPSDAVRKMADLETAVALKHEYGASGSMLEAQMELSKKVLICNPMEQNSPEIIRNYGCQWMGTSNYEYTAHIVPQYFKLMNEGKWDEALKLYWQMQPARDAKMNFHNTFKGSNFIHRNGWKYMGWLNGYNGGMIRMPQMRLSPEQMAGLRAGAVKSGLQVTSDPDEAFIFGRN